MDIVMLAVFFICYGSVALLTMWCDKNSTRKEN